MYLYIRVCVCVCMNDAPYTTCATPHTQFGPSVNCSNGYCVVWVRLPSHHAELDVPLVQACVLRLVLVVDVVRLGASGAHGGDELVLVDVCSLDCANDLAGSG